MLTDTDLMCPPHYVAFAERLADLARPVARRYFRTGVSADRKSDASPVTRADREIEQLLRETIRSQFPDHGIQGEEYGIENGDAEYLWVLDPIDGTKSFTIGKPTFGTLIALLRSKQPILGIIDQPITAERWVGAVGKTSTLNGAPSTSRPCASLEEAVLTCTSPGLIAPEDKAAFDRVEHAVRYPVWGGDCYIYGLLASGHVDLVIEGGLKAHDWSALIPVIEGGGGIITDWQGRPLTLNSDGRVVAAGSPEVHKQAVALLAG
ncbi:MAG: histidinol-phosphatase [Pseudomonadota bacterium]